MELLKRHKTPREDLRVNWSKEGGISRISEHSKIIGARKFAKNKMDHAKSNSRVSLVYGTLKKIVLDSKIQKGGCSLLIWPF